MEKSNVIRCFNEGKHYIETCLEQIVSLEQNDDKEMRIALKGVFMVKVSYKAAENFCKVVSYVIDGKDGAQQMKAELICLKEKLVQLYNGAAVLLAAMYSARVAAFVLESSPPMMTIAVRPFSLA